MNVVRRPIKRPVSIPRKKIVVRRPRIKPRINLTLEELRAIIETEQVVKKSKLDKIAKQDHYNDEELFYW